MLTGVAIGALACAILVANNLRDIAGDTRAGKRTLATRLGPGRTRALYAGLAGLAAVALVGVAALTSAWALLGLVGLLVLVPALRTVLSGGQGAALVAVLKTTGLAELVTAVGMAAGLVLGSIV
jgi:1,4-dihydroxy-2-naphthoate octaprenyltransferase